MNFDFSDEEKMVGDETAKFLAKHCDSDTVRQVLDGKERYAKTLWQGLAKMGLTASALPEHYGGANAGYLSLCLIARQLGASLAPTPFATTLYLFAEAVLVGGNETLKQRYLPAIAAGETTGTLAITESLSEVDPEHIQLRADNGSLKGSKLAVPNGSIADLAAVLARDTESDTLSLYVVDLRHPSVERKPIESIDPSYDTAQITFNNTPAERLGEAGSGWVLLQEIYDRAAVLFAFEQLGGAERAMNMAIAYAKDRFAFGKPIASFQALKHLIADMYVAIKLAESNCYYAAWALSVDAAELPLAAATARVSATQAFQLSAKENIQVHGGMGFTWEFDCHLYYRRSHYLALILGATLYRNKLMKLN